MATLESLDGKTYDVPEEVLARYRIGDATVTENTQHDDLPKAPPPQTGWDNYGMEPAQSQIQGLENNPFVRVKKGQNNSMIINVIIPSNAK